MPCFASLTTYIEGRLFFPPLPLQDYPQCFEAADSALITPLCTELFAEHRLESICAAYDGGQPLRTIVYCHGNNENLVKLVDYIRLLSHELKADVYAVEYPGYSSGDEAPTESACYESTSRFVRLLKGRERAPIVMLGFSMGCAPALRAAVDEGAAAVVLLAPFVSAASVALARGNESTLKWSPMWAPLDVFCTLPLARKLECNLLVVHGAMDAVIPPSHGRAVAAAARSSEYMELEEVMHSNVVRSEEAVDKVRRWLNKF